MQHDKDGEATQRKKEEKRSVEKEQSQTTDVCVIE